MVEKNSAGLTRQQEIEDDGKLLSIFFINGLYIYYSRILSAEEYE